jgi:NADH-quinone oxidoreductase subunit L
VLAVPSLLAGFWGIEAFLEKHFGQAGQETSWAEALFAPFGHAPLAALAGLGAVIFGFCFAYACYHQAVKDPLPEKMPGLSRALRNRFYFDEIYQKLIALSHEALARLADWFDRWIISGVAIRGLHGTTEILGRALRQVQTGNLQTYAFLIVLGVAVMLYLALSR